MPCVYASSGRSIEPAAEQGLPADHPCRCAQDRWFFARRLKKVKSHSLSLKNGRFRETPLTSEIRLSNIRKKTPGLSLGFSAPDLWQRVRPAESISDWQVNIWRNRSSVGLLLGQEPVNMPTLGAHTTGCGGISPVEVK
jgi:hypothetical protein